MATTRIINGRLYIRFTDPATSKRTEKSLGPAHLYSPADVARITKEMDRKLGAKIDGAQPHVLPTFGRFIEQSYLPWHRAQFPDSHARVYQIIRDHILPGWSDKPLDGIPKLEIETWKASRLGALKANKRKIKTQTVIKELRTLKAIFNFAVESEVLAKSPAAHVAAPKITDSKPHTYYTLAQLQDLYAACVTPWHGPAWKLYANTGMRRDEGMVLERRWVGQEGLKIVSTETKRSKSGLWRDIPLSLGAKEALESLPDYGKFVLPRVAGPSMSRASKEDLVAAGLEGSLHTLRHTFISHLMLDRTIPIRKIQLWAGHASITTTEGYAYLRAEAEEGLVNLKL